MACVAWKSAAGEFPGFVGVMHCSEAIEEVKHGGTKRNKRLIR